MTTLEPVAGQCRMSWAVFVSLPPVRAAAPTPSDLQALRNHLQRTGQLSRDNMVAVGASPLASWQRAEMAAAIPPRLTAASPRRKRRSGSNFPPVGAPGGRRYWDPFAGRHWLWPPGDWV